MFRVHTITTQCLSSRGCGNKLFSYLRSSLLNRHHYNHHNYHHHHYRLSKPCHSQSIRRLGIRYYHPGHRGDINNSWSRADMIKYWSMIKQMLPYVWPKGKPSLKARVVIAVCLLIAAKIVNVSVPFMFKNLVDFLNKGQSEPLNFDTPGSTVITAALSLVLAYGLFRAGSSLFNELRFAVFTKVSHDSIRILANKVFLHLHSLDLSFHLSRQTGALSKAIDRGSKGINWILSSLLFSMVPTFLEVLLASSILGYKCGPSFAFTTIGCVLGYSIFTFRFTKWRTKFRKNMIEAENTAGNHVVDSLINYESVKYFNNEKYEASSYDKVLKKYEEASLKTNISLALLNFGQSFIITTGLTGVMALATLGIIKGNMTVGDLVMVNGLVFQLSVPLNFLGTVYRETTQALEEMKQMFAILSIKSAIKDKPGAPYLSIAPENASVIFEDVCFGYTDQQILRGLSFEIPAKKKVAFVGGSGSGKTTIVRLMYRFFDPEQGRVLVSGCDVRDMQLEGLRRAISVVPQDPVLFNNTIEYNLHYGNFEAPLEKVFEASQMAEIHDSIQRWPAKYDTQVGERGLKLSGGEKQRVAIARAILKGSPILIFDEATSSLDSLTEYKVLKALSSASQDRTTICIAHRLSTVVDADLIYVLQDGKVAEIGTHRTLVNKPSSLYAQLWARQHAEDRKLKKS